MSYIPVDQAPCSVASLLASRVGYGARDGRAVCRPELMPQRFITTVLRFARPTPNRDDEKTCRAVTST